MIEIHPSVWCKLAGCDIVGLDHDPNCRRCKEVSAELEQLKPMPIWLSNTIEQGASMGRRNLARFKLINNLWRLGFSKDFILAKVLEFNRNCQPPEPERVVQYHVNYTIKRLAN